MILLIYTILFLFQWQVTFGSENIAYIHICYIYVCMATLSARSMLLSHLQEGTSIANACIKLGHRVTCDLRFHRRRRLQCPSVVVLKFKTLSCTKKPTSQLHLLRPYGHSCNLGSRSLQQHKGEGDSSPTSPPSTPTNIPRVGNL